VVVLSPFPDLESFLASVGGAAVLCGLITLVAGVAAIVTRRGTARTASVIGGGAGVGVPAVLFLLGLDTAFPILIAIASIAGAFGAFALASGAAELLLSEPDA
jgi:predicted permease